MTFSIFGCIAAALAVPLALQAITWRIKSRLAVAEAASLPAIFRVAPWVYALCLIWIAMGGLFVSWGHESDKATSFFYMIGIITILIGAGAIWSFARTQVSVDLEKIEYRKHGFTRFLMLQDIARLHLISGQLKVSGKGDEELLIPLLFGRMEIFIKTIEAYAKIKSV